MSALNPAGKHAITILVLGDAGVGKSCLISSLVSESWNDGSRVPPVLQPVMVPPSLMSEGIGLTIIDTSSDPAHESEWALHLRPLPSAASGSGPASASSAASSLGSGGGSASLSSLSQASKASLQADAILLVVSSDVPDSFARVESHWLPLLESLAARFGVPRKPVVLAINKSSQDGSGASDASSMRPPTRVEYDATHGSGGYSPTPSHPSFSHLLASNRISAVIACSAKYLHHLSHIFYACQLVILAPIEPLFDLHAPPPQLTAGSSGSGSGVGSNPGSLRFKLLTQKALLRIFRLFDADADGLLDFAELDAMHQVNFQGKRISSAAFDTLMRTMEGMNKEFVRAVSVPAAGAERNNSSGANGHGISSNGSNGAHIKYGLTFSGLLHFHYLFLKKNRHLSHCWTIVNLFGYQLAAATNSMGANTTVPSAAAAAATTAAQQNQVQSAMQIPAIARGSSQQGAAASSTGAAASSLSASGATISGSTAPLPSLGSLVLKESYCSLLGEPFHASCSYELSPVAILFLTRLFKRYDADGDGMLCVRNPPAAAAGTPASSLVIPDAAPSSTCSLSASTDLERMFLASPDIPFAIPSFTKFVANAATASSKAALGGSYLSLDGWLASWALLLYNYATTPLVVPVAASSAPAAAAAAAASPIVPNPDILLRYLHYLCFPVTPALPEFAWTDPTTGLAPESMLAPQAPAVAGAAAGGKPKPPTKVYLPLIQRCIHLTPRSAAAIDFAQSLNERIQSTDSGASSAAIRQSVADPSNLRPRTVVVHVMGSAGCGVSSLIDCMLGNAPSQPFAQPVTSATVAGLHGAHGTASSATKSDAAAIGSSMELSPTPSASAASSSFAAAAAAGAAAAVQPRTFAARLPLAHLPSSSASLSPLVAVAGVGAGGVSDVSVIDPALASDPARFLLLKEIPSASAAAILGAPSYTAASCDLLLLLYEPSSPSSLQFALQRLQACFDKSIPVLLVQSKSDLLGASTNPGADMVASTDFNVARVESWSARAFWEATLKGKATAAANLHALAIFERIWQAGRHNAPYVLTSQSAARRASQRNRLILGSVLGIAATIGAYFLAPWAMQRYGIAVPRSIWPMQQHQGKQDATWRAADTR